MQMMERLAHLVLEDGTVFTGRAVGAAGVAAGEACFTTASTGYEEAATDPSYVAQVLCFAYPLVGNYGVDPGRAESDRVQAEAIVMRTARPEWAAWLRAQNVVAIADVDTRALVRRIREDGVLRCAVGDAPPDELHARALAQPPIDGRPLDRRVGVTEPFFVGAGPRAALVGNGPGDPAVFHGPIETVRELLGRVPLFGICLGHQLLGLALGLDTFKLPFGHRGANHLVCDTRTGRVLVTVQNHGFAVHVDEHVSHVSLNDGTVEGFAGEDFASVQFHPEAAPGPL